MVGKLTPRSMLEGSLLWRLLLFGVNLWEQSLLYRLLTGLASTFGRVFAGSVLGRLWYSDWPGKGEMQQSSSGRAVLGLERVVTRAGQALSPWVGGVWETSLIGGLWRRVASHVGPWLGTSYFAQGLFGWPGDVKLAPAETTRATSPAVYVLGFLLGFLPLLPDGATQLMVVGIWGSAALWLVHKVMVRDFTWRASSAALPLFILLVLAAISSVQSVARSASLLSFVFWLSAILLFFLLMNMVRNTRDAAVFLGPVLIGCVLMTLWALYQVKNPPLVEEAWVDVEVEGAVTRVFASMKNPNYLAEYMVLFLPPAIALWFHEPKRRISLTLIIGAMVLTLLLTGSRGGQLAFGIALALAVFMRFPRWTPLLILGAVLFLQVAPASITDRLATAFSMTHSSNTYRVNIWKGVGRMLKEHWVLGSGLGAEAFGRLYQYFMLPAARAAHAHNSYLQMLAEMGVFGFFAFLWSLVAVIRRIFVVGVSQRTSMLVPAAATALIGLLFHGLVEHIWYNPKLLFAFWAVAGIGIGVALGNREDAAA